MTERYAMIMPRNARVWLAILGLGLFTGVSHAQAPPPSNLIYEIFVRSFADSDNDAKHIGDLKGIVGKLDSYLNDGDPRTNHDLEVGILWLMPVFPSPSYHGYDVTDYRNINGDYGTLDDFKTLDRGGPSSEECASSWTSRSTIPPTSIPGSRKRSPTRARRAATSTSSGQARSGEGAWHPSPAPLARS